MGRLAFVFVAACLVTPASAQDSIPQGIGFAQAEEGTWLCRDEDPIEALACAREHCLEEAPGQECVQTAWCYPARWSGTITVWLEDFHTTRILCGMADEETLRLMLAALCLTELQATHCDLTLTVDPDGNERQITDVSFDGGGAPLPEASSDETTPDTSGDDAPPPETNDSGDAPTEESQ